MDGRAMWEPGHLPSTALPPAEDGEALAALLGDVAEILDHLGAAASRLGAPGRADLFGEVVAWQEEVRQWTLVQAVLEEAEWAVRLAAYRQLVAAALARLAGRRGLAWTPLDPTQRSAIYLVVCDGRELGLVDPAATRYAGGRIQRRTWRATPAGHRLGELGPFRTIRTAAEGLARHAGLTVPAAQRVSGTRRR
jgi:hypothetical protein